MSSPYRITTIKWSKHQTTLMVVSILMLTIAAFALGFLANQYMAMRNTAFPLLTEAFLIFRDNAYDDIPPLQKIEYGMIRGMLSTAQDPFNAFYEPPQNELQSNQLQGKFGGIGVRIERDSSGIIHLYPLPDSVGGRAGLQDGDILISVDKLVVSPQTQLDEIQAAIRGPIDSTVNLLIRRGSDEIPMTIQRAEVAIPSVTYNLVPDRPEIGVIQVNIIAASTPNEILSAVAELSTRGARALVLDLRNNGGGLVDAGVQCARLFLPKGVVVIEEQFRGEPVQTYTTQVDGSIKLPLAVLVNQNTASAAEILAGALQFHQRALLVGSQTYGKDSVQKVFDLSDGSSIHVTAGKWWLPGQKEDMGEDGLTPDVQLSQEDANGAPALYRAIDALLP